MAQRFLEETFPHNIVSDGYRHSGEPRYEVWLDNGYQIFFYAGGRWQRVDAGVGITIARSMAGDNVTLHINPVEVVRAI